MNDDPDLVGYKGTTTVDVGIFVAPYIPLFVYTPESGWKAILRRAGYDRLGRAMVNQRMQELYPGAYQVVEIPALDVVTLVTRYGIETCNNRYTFTLVFDTPQDETWFYLQYE